MRAFEVIINLARGVKLGKSFAIGCASKLTLESFADGCASKLALVQIRILTSVSLLGAARLTSVSFLALANLDLSRGVIAKSLRRPTLVDQPLSKFERSMLV